MKCDNMADETDYCDPKHKNSKINYITYLTRCWFTLPERLLTPTFPANEYSCINPLCGTIPYTYQSQSSPLSCLSVSLSLFSLLDDTSSIHPDANCCTLFSRRIIITSAIHFFYFLFFFFSPPSLQSLFFIFYIFLSLLFFFLSFPTT